jgi:hypothetical protein
MGDETLDSVLDECIAALQQLAIDVQRTAAAIRAIRAPLETQSDCIDDASADRQPKGEGHGNDRVIPGNVAVERPTGGETWWRKLDQPIDIAQILGDASQGWPSGGGNAAEHFVRVTKSGGSALPGRSFYESETYFVKVHDFSVGSKTEWRRAGTAFIEASATSYVCRKESWWCRTFGVFCGSGNDERAYVFIVRHKLSPMTGNDDDIVASAVEVYLAIAERHSVLQNDAHMFNVMAWPGNGLLQALDFERASRLGFDEIEQQQREEVWNHLKTFHKEYCMRICRRHGTESKGITTLMMRQVVSCGLANTHDYFSQFFKNGSFRDTAFNEEAFANSTVTEWKYCAWLHLLHHLYSQDLSPRLEEVAVGARTEFVISFDIVIGTVGAGNHSCHVQFAEEHSAMSQKFEVLIRLVCVRQGINDTRTIGVDRFQTLSPDTETPWRLVDFDTTHRFATTVLEILREDRGEPDDGKV